MPKVRNKHSKLARLTRACYSSTQVILDYAQEDVVWKAEGRKEGRRDGRKEDDCKVSPVAGSRNVALVFVQSRWNQVVWA